MAEVETIISINCGLGRITLNRPKVLNALSAGQYGELTETLTRWEEADEVSLVLLEGMGERAFCAGGDIRMVWDAAKRGDHDFNRSIFRAEYRLNRRIHRYPKPYVSILDGIVMGGGAGISVNGRWRVATERTRFAMPEAGIGFFPDVGATSFLGHCPGQFGLYLGLTGARLDPADCLWAGIATHYIPVEYLDQLRDGLAKAAGSTDPTAAAQEVLDGLHRDPGIGPMALRCEAVDRCFGQGSLNQILAALREEKGDWARDTIEDMMAHSPTSLSVAYRQLTEGRGLDFDQVMAREFRLACRFLEGQDFYEGIRAQVVDKDHSPVWSPDAMALVDEAMVTAYFAPLGDDELPLP